MVMMSRVKKGIVAGFVATIALSAVEAINLHFGWFEPFQSVLTSVIGLSGNEIAGWAIQFIGGIVILGGLFGYLYPKLPTDTPETKGIAFSVGVWSIVMAVIVLFGGLTSGSGFDGMAWQLGLHAVYGIIIGNVYNRLVKREKRRLAAGIAHGAPAV